MSLLKIDSISYFYKKNKKAIQVLRSVSFSFNQGESIALMGPSGAGKSTLLSVMAGLRRPQKGFVYYNGQNIYTMNDNQQANFRNRTTGFVFQYFYLLEVLTSLENVMMPLLIRNTPYQKASERAKEMIDSVGLKDRVDHRPAELSGGEAQRIGIARALVGCPKILFADEPTGNLDSDTSQQIIDIMKCLCANQHTVLVVATHNQRIADQMDNILKLKEGEIIK